MSIHKKSTGVWYVSYRDSNGRQRTKSFGRGKAGKDAAEVHNLEIKRDKKLGREVKAPNQQGIYDLAQAYVNDLRLNGKSQEFVAQIISLINNHLGPLIDNKPIDKLTYAEVTQKVMEYGEGRGTSKRTTQKHLRYLRTIFRFGIRHDMINVNPLEKWRGQKHRPKPVSVTLEDLQRIKENAVPHLQWAIEVELNLGTRPGKTELFALKWSDVDYEYGMVQVYRHKTGTYDRIPVSDEFLEQLREKHREAESDHIVEYKGKPVNQLATSWRTAKKKAGITYKLPLYDIRHLFASLMMKEGANLVDVSKLLGHADITTTQRHYLHLLEGGQRDAIQKLRNALNRKPKKEGKVVRLVS